MAYIIRDVALAVERARAETHKKAQDSIHGHYGMSFEVGSGHFLSFILFLQFLFP